MCGVGNFFFQISINDVRMISLSRFKQVAMDIKSRDCKSFFFYRLINLDFHMIVKKLET